MEDKCVAFLPYTTEETSIITTLASAICLADKLHWNKLGRADVPLCINFYYLQHRNVYFPPARGSRFIVDSVIPASVTLHQRFSLLRSFTERLREIREIRELVRYKNRDKLSHSIVIIRAAIAKINATYTNKL